MKTTPVRKGRVGRGTALAALCALALTACGTEGAGSGTPSGPGAGQAARPTPSRSATPAASRSATPTAPATDPADDPARTPEEQAAELRFMRLMVTVAQPCMEGLPPGPPLEPDGPPSTDVPPSEDPVELPTDAPPPPSPSPWNFEQARQEVELESGDKCVAPLHGKRIAKALEGGTAATPAAVEKALKGIGYDVPYRVHGPRQVNGKVEFTLDLRSMGGFLCLSGSYDGTRTSFDPYGASPDVRCPDVKRRG
ncbi:hypothetical protein ABZ318_09390 [Streptomyces sp. NPDC006197]|uniref:hypothetical protein n=1 Tax=Streptomyces sp. NPDC006197 TaxID=3156685 RepID=UPI0033A8D0CB